MPYTPPGQLEYTPVVLVEKAGLACDVFRDPPRRSYPYGNLAVARDDNVWLDVGDIPCWTYQFWDRDGHLLYVGIADDLNQRGGGHRAGSVWWPFAARAEFTLFASREEALDAEWLLIRMDKPIFNVTHAMTGPERMVEYLAQREAWLAVDQLIEKWDLQEPAESAPPASARSWSIPSVLEPFFPRTVGPVS